MQELTFKVNSLNKIKLPMTVFKKDITVIDKGGSHFDEHEDFIKQAIIKVLASSSEIRKDARNKLLDAIREQMNNERISMVIMEFERGLNAYKIA